MYTILVDVTRNPVTGIGKYSWNLLEFLSKENNNVFIGLTLPEYTKYADERQIKFLITPTIPSSIKEIEQLSKLIDQSANIYLATNFSQLVLPQIPIIQVVHDIIYLKNPDLQPSIKDIEMRRGAKFVDFAFDQGIQWLRDSIGGKLVSRNLPASSTNVAEAFTLIQSYYIARASAIVAISHTTKELLRDHFIIDQPLEVIYPIIHPHKFSSTNKQLDDDKLVYFLYIANFEPRKNHKLLFDAVAHLPAELIKNIRVILIGNAMLYNSQQEEFSRNLEEYRELIHVEIHQNLSEEEKFMWLKKANFMVYPSVTEGFGLPLLEAMQVGLPIIALETPTSREICGDSAIYFKENATTSLVDALLFALENREYVATHVKAQTKELTKFNTNNINRVFDRLVQHVMNSPKYLDVVKPW